MAVAFDAVSSGDTRVAGATSLSHTNLTVGSGANRALVVLLVFSSLSVTAISCTWDSGGTNQAASSITSIGNGAGGLSVLFGLVAPTSGNKTLAVSWSGSSDCTCAAISFTNANQTGGTTTFANAATNTGSSTGSTVTVATNAASAVVASLATKTGISSLNHTTIYTDNSGANNSAGGNYEVGGSTATMTGTNSVSGLWAMCGVSVAPLSSGGLFRPAPLALGSGGPFFANPLQRIMLPRAGRKPVFACAREDRWHPNLQGWRLAA